MEIILKGQHNTTELMEDLQGVLNLLNKRYQVANFREINLSLTLVDLRGEVVELVDNESNEVYRILEVYRRGCELAGKDGPLVHLVVDNTR
jgi:hypothetical protein